MKHDSDALWPGSTSLGRWRVFTRPGAIIQATVLDRSPEMRRRPTVTGVETLPPPRPG
ncbi:MAG TPA: hypothetical protein VF142_20165 [Longimicrobium sp.]